MKNILLKYKSIILYLVFGVLTTVINIASYAVCYNFLKLPNVLSNIIAWVLSVGFAFITNKLWVFDSKSLALKTFFAELWKFTAARLATGLLDLAIMYFAVDLMHGNGLVFKIISNVIVIVLNYVLSKLVVFDKK